MLLCVLGDNFLIYFSPELAQRWPIVVFVVGTKWTPLMNRHYQFTWEEDPLRDGLVDEEVFREGVQRLEVLVLLELLKNDLSFWVLGLQLP